MERRERPIARRARTCQYAQLTRSRTRERDTQVYDSQPPAGITAKRSYDTQRSAIYELPLYIEEAHPCSCECDFYYINLTGPESLNSTLRRAHGRPYTTTFYIFDIG